MMLRCPGGLRRTTPLSTSRTHSSVVERKLSKLEVKGSKPFECMFKYETHI
jgi:hypothetical protein